MHLIEIDECPNCGGIWLDTGELTKLRDNHLPQSESALLRENLIKDIEHGSYRSSASISQEMNETADRWSKIIDTMFSIFRA